MKINKMFVSALLLLSIIKLRFPREKSIIYHCVALYIQPHQYTRVMSSIIKQAFRLEVKLVVNNACYWLKQITRFSLSTSRKALSASWWPK